MTLAAATPVIRYDGDDAATNFSFPYIFWDATEIVLTHRAEDGTITTPVKDTDYTVNGGDGSTGDVDFPIGGSTYSTLASGTPDEQLTISRVLPVSRDVDQAGTYHFDTANLEGDENMAIQQQQQHQLDRSLKQPISDSDSLDMTIPSATDRASKVAGYDANGEPIVVSGTVAIAEATANEIDSDTTDRYVAPDKLAASKYAAALNGQIRVEMIGAGGGVLATGAQKVYLKMPYACTITGWWVDLDQSDTITLDVWIDAWSASSRPTVADTIIDTGSGGIKPNVGGAALGEKYANLNNWTVAVGKDDVVEINIDAVGGTATKAILHMDVIKTGA
jgi:hypothetical protein